MSAAYSESTDATHTVVHLPDYSRMPAPAGNGDSEPLNPLALIIGETVRDALFDSAVTAPRSLQREFGPSDLGEVCDRRLAYHLAGVRPAQYPDPFRAEVGRAVHEYIADTYRKIDAGSGRYLVEHPVTYRGITGRVDILDRRRHIVTDWKTTTLRSRKMRKGGAPWKSHLVQVSAYGLGLRAQGERVDYVSVVMLPVDGELSDIRPWVSPLNGELIAAADAAVDRVLELSAKQPNPADVKPTPNPLCPWCPWYKPDSPDLSIACPGKEE